MTSTLSQKTIHLIFDHSFGRCNPIYKILRFWGKFLYKYHRDSQPHLKYVCTL